MYTALNNQTTNNDCDEDGRDPDPSESCRLVRGNGDVFRMTYHFRVGGPKAAWQVDSFRNAASKQKACLSLESGGFFRKLSGTAGFTTRLNAY